MILVFRPKVGRLVSYTYAKRTHASLVFCFKNVIIKVQNFDKVEV